MATLSKNWVDLVSAVAGIIYVYILYRQGKLPDPKVSLATGFVFIEGLSIAPLALLMPAAFFPDVLKAVVESSRLTLVSAAVLAIFAILGPRWNPTTPPPAI